MQKSVSEIASSVYLEDALLLSFSAASQFIQLYGSTEEQGVASDLLQQLETATHNLISSSSIDRYLFTCASLTACSLHSTMPVFKAVLALNQEWEAGLS